MVNQPSENPEFDAIAFVDELKGKPPGFSAKIEGVDSSVYGKIKNAAIAANINVDIETQWAPGAGAKGTQYVFIVHVL